MANINISPKDLLRVEDRISFVYLEHCTIGRDGGALTATDDSGVTYVPVSAVSVILLGPGTRVTHPAMTVIGESGCAVMWVGESGTRYYAHGRGVARSSRLLIQQARLCSNRNQRLAVARAMYAMRFPEEDTSSLTMQQLRGKEGARVRKIYRQCATEYDVEWHGREYDPQDFAGGSIVNQALSAAHCCLYGLVHAVIVGLGCAPGLGFVHCGHDRSFVYDIADLYKAQVTIPVAFRIAKQFEDVMVNESDLGRAVRYELRDQFRDRRLAEQIVHDIKTLLLADEVSSEDIATDKNTLWDGKTGSIAGGVNYGDG
ncbi:type I-E CRISPR-associated endonuclease Cas1e [Corynebacterium choanae]|uniref:CRISPR-associated endonuclease Cas1 n=1 Tax=Corynebacterium choanae TaxID=1862358 RepID=A0A3G6J3C7_9CORY|nr:type I-E CRISPR-associated endonuclease Cas1e [Corynebacterium choanae]AZA12565.1 CRISPR-associated endonuclease Cas1 [Corynebacterium choanae]